MPVSRRPKRIGILVVVVALTAAVCMRAFSDPVPMKHLQKLRRGMTKDEVQRILGSPSKVYDGQWTYQRPFVFGFVNIHWQANGTFDGDYNYERF